MYEFLKKHDWMEVKLTFIKNEGIKVTLQQRMVYPESVYNFIISNFEIERSNIPLEDMIVDRLNDIYEMINHKQ